jgi:hypothetical protein
MDSEDCLVSGMAREGTKAGTDIKAETSPKTGTVEVSGEQAGAGAGAGTGTQKTFWFRVGQGSKAEKRNSDRSSNRSRYMNKSRNRISRSSRNRFGAGTGAGKRAGTGT